VRASTPKPCTTTSWPFPPNTHEVQFDEKWAFVGKKEKHCDRADPDDDQQGDCWDHVALDPKHRLVVSVVVGRQSGEHTDLLMYDFQQRTEGRTMNLMSSDENPAYVEAIRQVYGQDVQPSRHRHQEPDRTSAQRLPKQKHRPKKLVYATVHKTRVKGRVVAVEQRLIFGTAAGLGRALANSVVSAKVNTAYSERQHGTDRHRNARKGRKTYRFSKDWQVHEAVSYFTLYSYNFCWPVRTLRQRDADGHWQRRTPAMSAGLTDHVWPLREWLALPARQ
jgi:IS1 family transposase